MNVAALADEERRRKARPSAREGGDFRRGSKQIDRKMLEARHTMDVPTTTSADNGTSGDSDGGGWFTPCTQPKSPGGGSEPEGHRLAAMRPMGRHHELLSEARSDRDDVPRERYRRLSNRPAASRRTPGRARQSAAVWTPCGTRVFHRSAYGTTRWRSWWRPGDQRQQVRRQPRSGACIARTPSMFPSR